MQTAKTNTKSTGQFFANIIRTHGTPHLSPLPITLLTTFRRPPGLRGAYDGLTAAMLRALTYSTFRFGAYEFVKANWLPRDPSMVSMLGASAGAGGFAGLLGVPAGE